MESTEVTTSSSSSKVTVTTSSTRRSRSRGRTPERVPESKSPSRSPGRRKALNRSPSPHRYNTRNSQATEETSISSPSKGCCVLACCSSLKSLVCSLVCLLKDVAKCASYISLAYVALTMCGAKCDLALPVVPSCSILWRESAMLHTLLVFAVMVVSFFVPFGEVAKGIPTNRGTLSYICNAPFAVALQAALLFGHYYYDPKSVNIAGSELQCLASIILLVVVIAVVMAWKGKSLGIYCNVLALIDIFYFIDKRFNVTGAPLFHLLTAVIVLTCLFTSLAVGKAFLDESVNDCMVIQASRGLVVLSIAWSLAYTNQVYTFKMCGIQSFLLFSILTGVVKLCVWLLYKKECCKKACLAVITVCVALAGLFYQQKLIYVPESFTPVWFVWNIWAVAGYLGLLVWARKINVFGSFKPLSFVKQVLEGEYDPRIGNFDVKFFCIRAGLLHSVVVCGAIALSAHREDNLKCSLSSVLGYTLLYALTKLVYMEKTITSLPEIVEKKCSLSFMLWSLVVSPVLLTMPVRYVAAASIEVKCTWLQCAITLAFLVGLGIYALTTTQGHYLLLGEKHYTTDNLTTLQANGDEEIPIGGMWKILKYPFLTGEIMVIACLSLSTGFDGPLVYLPLLIILVNSVVLVRSYNAIAPSFYGVRVWKDYQKMVPANIVPLFY